MVFGRGCGYQIVFVIGFEDAGTGCSDHAGHCEHSGILRIIGPPNRTGQNIARFDIALGVSQICNRRSDTDQLRAVVGLFVKFALLDVIADDIFANDTFIPIIVLLAVPVFLGLLMVVSGYRYFRRSVKQRRRLEQALRQRHHLILGLFQGAIAPLRWVPLIAAINSAVPHYLEMAADNTARSRTSTPVLASALLKLGERSGPGVAHDACGAIALHAAGIDRIRHLVAPPNGKHGLASISTMVPVTGILLAGSLAVHLPYLNAILDGCLM